jgi:hypothetical protein
MPLDSMIRHAAASEHENGRRRDDEGEVIQVHLQLLLQR